jgi:hypothetical protein
MYAYSNPINFGDKSGSTVGPAIPYGNPDDASAAASAAADIGSAAVGQVFDELSLIPFTGAVWNIFRPGAMRYGADRMWMRVWSTQFTLDMMDHFQWQALDRFQWMQAWRLHFPNNWIASFIDNWVLPGLDDLDFIGSMPSPGIPGGGGGGGGGSGPSGVSGGWNLGAIIEFGIIAWLLSLVGIGIF